MNPRDLETVNEVVAEMREMLAAYEKSGLWPKFGPSEIRHYADRLDAAVKRERENFRGCIETAGKVIDSMKMQRDAARTERDFARRGICRDCRENAERVPMTLDEAIEHAASRMDGTPCGRDHEQLALWLLELRRLRESKPGETYGNAAEMRYSLELILEMAQNGYRAMTGVPGSTREIRVVETETVCEIANTAISSPPRNCDVSKDTAEERYLTKFGRPWTTQEDELAAWLFAPAEGGAK